MMIRNSDYYARFRADFNVRMQEECDPITYIESQHVYKRLVAKAVAGALFASLPSFHDVWCVLGEQRAKVEHTHPSVHVMGSIDVVAKDNT